MLIIIDTNIIVQDFRLMNASSRLLIENSRLAGHALAIPDLVIQESVKKFAESLHKDLKTAQELSQSISRKIGSTFTSIADLHDVTRYTSDYERYLRKRLQEHGASIIPLPEVAHQDLVTRLFKGRKPFSLDGRLGYRDALIWETIRGLAKQEKTNIVFISYDMKDFAGQENQLHDDLIEDIVSDGLAKNAVILFVNVKDFVDKHITPNIPNSLDQVSINQIIEKLKSSSNSSIEEVVSEALHDHLKFYRVDEYEFKNAFLHLHVEDVSICSMQSLTDLNFLKEVEILENEAVVEMTASLECEFDAYIYKSDYYGMSEEEENRLGIHLVDVDWNDHYAAISFVAQVSLSSYLTIDLKNNCIKDIEVLNIDFV